MWNLSLNRILQQFYFRVSIMLSSKNIRYVIQRVCLSTIEVILDWHWMHNMFPSSIFRQWNGEMHILWEQHGIRCDVEEVFTMSFLYSIFQQIEVCSLSWWTLLQQRLLSVWILYIGTYIWLINKSVHMPNWSVLDWIFLHIMSTPQLLW